MRLVSWDTGIGARTELLSLAVCSIEQNTLRIRLPAFFQALRPSKAKNKIVSINKHRGQKNNDTPAPYKPQKLVQKLRYIIKCLLK